jgi:hypothetical protein
MEHFLRWAELRDADYIVSVNGVDCERSTKAEVKKLIDATPEGGELVLVVANAVEAQTAAENARQKSFLQELAFSCREAALTGEREAEKARKKREEEKARKEGADLAGLSDLD